MDFVNIFAWSHPSQLRVFVRFENSYSPGIWKMSNLVFIFNILFSFTLDKMMVIGVKKIMNWQVAITICNSFWLQTANGDNNPYILQRIINSL